jgi:spermidine synthase
MTRISNTRGAIVIFAVALSTLASQVLFHRVISAKLLNNYAFLVISLTMLGFACSGVILSRKLNEWLGRFSEMLALWAALFVLTSLGATLLFYHSSIGSQDFVTREDFVLTLLSTVPYALLFSVPFLFSGLLLGSILAAPAFSARKMYCWDLIGSACGALLVIPMISSWGLEKAMLWVDVALLATVFLAARPNQRRSQAMVGLAAVSLIGSLAFERQFFVLRYPAGTMLAHSYTNPEWVIEHTAWDPVARIEMTRMPPFTPEEFGYPALVGSNPEFLAKFKRILTQNNFAFTVAVEYDGNPATLRGIEETIYSGAYLPRTVPDPKVAIIGVGGGFDILTALAFNAREVTGIDVNSATLRILKEDYADYFASWVKDPKVELVRDDGRHYLAGTEDRFDIIQLSGVDTYSGSPGAAHVFSENFLYSLEAFRLYFSRLSEAGVLNVMRLEHRFPREMLRGLATAMTALRLEGITKPADHIIMLGARSRNFVALLVKKTPFTEEEVNRVRLWGEGNKYSELLAAPYFEPSEPNVYRAVLGLNDAKSEQTFFDQGWPFLIAPTTDDRPFFFQFAKWSHLFSDHEAIKKSVPVMHITLCILFVVTASIAVACVWWPLRKLKQAQQPATQSWRYGVIFSGTAVAFMAIEMALLQRFGLFLGHPNYALSVVLAGLLFTSGIGAFLSERLSGWLRGPRNIAYLLAGFALMECFFAFPYLSRWQVDAFLPRAAIVIALIAPLGVLMGTFVPLALDTLKRIAPSLAPWAWGVNGIFSVMAPILSVAFSITWGVNALFLASIPVYIVASWCFPNRDLDKAPITSSQAAVAS